MRIRFAIAVALAGVVLACIGARAVPIDFGTDTDPPPVIRDTQTALTCSVTFMIVDTASGDMYAQRVRIPPSETDQAANNRLPCPPDVVPRLPTFAREACGIRATDRGTCVYADMSRDFVSRPDIANTAAATSRCQSDTASHIGVACWWNGATPVCAVGCGNSAAEAIARAKSRCEEKQQRSCPASVALAVSDQAPSSPDAPASRPGAP